MSFIVKTHETAENNKMAAREAPNLYQSATRDHLGRWIDCEQFILGGNILYRETHEYLCMYCKTCAQRNGENQIMWFPKIYSELKSHILLGQKLLCVANIKCRQSYRFFQII